MCTLPIILQFFIKQQSLDYIGIVLCYIDMTTIVHYIQNGSMLKTANSRLSKIINSDIKITEHPDLEVYYIN